MYMVCSYFTHGDSLSALLCSSPAHWLLQCTLCYSTSSHWVFRDAALDWIAGKCTLRRSDPRLSVSLKHVECILDICISIRDNSSDIGVVACIYSKVRCFDFSYKIQFVHAFWTESGLRRPEYWILFFSLCIVEYLLSCQKTKQKVPTMSELFFFFFIISQSGCKEKSVILRRS
jgi:hypothetical protein